MSSLFPNTRPAAEFVLIRLLRDAPPWRRQEMVGQMNEAVKTMMLNGLSVRYPKGSPEEIKRRMAGLLLGEEQALKVSGALPEDLDAG